jgi:hypothetical protein
MWNVSLWQSHLFKPSPDADEVHEIVPVNVKDVGILKLGETSRHSTKSLEVLCASLVYSVPKVVARRRS